MTTKQADPWIETLVKSLAEVVDLAHICKLHETARLLSIAQLDLHMRVNGISDLELRTFCHALEDRKPGGPEASVEKIWPFDPAKFAKQSGQQWQPTSDGARAQRTRKRS